MDAMILAAGLGTRLGDLTRDVPKALVDVAGTTPLEHVARSLIAAGADRLIINVHHHADRIMEHVAARDGFGVEVVFSHERDAPLETGGGILHAAPLFRRDAPFLVHNVDVLCDADLRLLYEAHCAGSALATLAVNQRPTRRYLIFDEQGLCGRMDMRNGPQAEMHAAAGDVVRFAFAGIHVASPALFPLITERGAFSILDVYLRLVAAGHQVGRHDITDATWLEVGTPERLEAARRAFGG
jgi:N-acetyl-alpha-D-muramate 1-phosphate uridylyltransferase